MRYLSICSGIEAATVAWHGFGWEPVGFSEIEPFPSAVLAHHYPEVPNLGDMTKFKEWQVDAFDVLVGGTPCQAFSVAGLRQSLDDARGNLSLVFCEMADHFDPPYILWENVPGVLNTKDNAFGCFLARLAGEDVPLVPAGKRWTNAGFVLGPKRNVAWRVLDAQYFGLAQRRRRVFVVACPRDGADPREVLFEREGVQRHSAPSREAGKGFTGVAGTLSANRGGLDRPAGNANELDFHNTGGIGMSNQELFSQKGAGLVPIPFRVHGEHSTAMTGNGVARVADEVEVSRSLDSCGGYATNQGGNVVMQPVVMAHGQGNAEIVSDGSPSLTCNHEATIAFHPTVSCMRESGQGYWMEDEIAGTLRAEGEDRPSRPSHVVAFAQNPLGEVRTGEVANTLTVGGGKPGQGYPAVAIGWSEELTASKELAGTLQYGGQGGRHDGVMTPAMQVRRLTPVECERLQGFPDGYTAIPWRNKPVSECPDGPRYKALGNSMAVPVMRWIGGRIRKTGI